MKPLYIFLLLFAVLITGLADGLDVALSAIPGIGFILGLAISYCINITMGAGLLIALVSFDMYHPRISPFGIVAGLIPGLNVLPFWVGLVVAGIVYKMNAEGENLGGITSAALKLQSVYQSGGSPFQKMRQAGGVVMNERRATGRPPAAAGPEPQQETPERTPRTMTDLKSPRFAPNINRDIAPQRTPPYAKAA